MYSDILKRGFSGPFPQAPELAPPRPIVILPGLGYLARQFEITPDFEQVDWGDRLIEWKSQADNSPQLRGQIRIKDIEIDDQRTQIKPLSS